MQEREDQDFESLEEPTFINVINEIFHMFSFNSNDGVADWAIVAVEGLSQVREYRRRK
jgi:hypothetical protein